MAFKLVTNPTFKHTIIAQVPVDGGYKDERFKATFRVLSLAEVDEFDTATAEGTTEFLQAVIVELHEIIDDNGEPLTYSDDVRDAVLQIPYARRALSDGYFDAISKARQGNSKR